MNRIILLTIVSLIILWGFIHQYRKCLQEEGLKAPQNFVLGFLGAIVLGLLWYFVMPYHSTFKIVHASIVGPFFFWILNFVKPSYSRLLGSSVLWALGIIYSFVLKNG